ncbi:MAG: hypothetical protein K2X26_01685 [Chitinophagaceae bacterium]|nr:hypothetical protein [Chitinophagaceae bacterium]
MEKAKMLKINLGEYNQSSSKININTQSANNIFEVKTFRDAEIQLITKTLELCQGKIRDVGGSFELLQLQPTTLESKMKKLGIVKKRNIEVIDIT